MIFKGRGSNSVIAESQSVFSFFLFFFLFFFSFSFSFLFFFSILFFFFSFLFLNPFLCTSSSVLHSWESVIAATERTAKVHGATAKKITETCAESVNSFIKDLEQKQKLYVAEGNKCTKEYEDICSALEKVFHSLDIKLTNQSKKKKKVKI